MGTWVAGALHAAGVTTTVHVRTRAQETSVELEGGGFHARLERQDDHLASTADGLSQLTLLPKPTDYLLLREELGIVHRDPVFSSTLESAARFSFVTD
jgi:hypothetical protein